MRSLLVVALFAVARGNPQFAYTVGSHSPYVFTNGHTAYHTTPSQPLSYVRPQLYANNACRNTLGQLVPCALPSIAGNSVYAYNSVPNTGFVQAAAGVAAIPAVPAVDADMPPAPEAPAAPVKAKREAEASPEASPEAEADPYYYFGRVGAYGYPGYYHPYFYGHQGWGCRNAAGTLVPCAAHVVGKREAEAEPEAKPAYGYHGYPYSYGHYGYPYAAHIGKREAEAEPEAKPEANADAEADPHYLVGRVGAYGYPGYYHPYAYGYHAYPYSYGHYGYPYVARYLGKREAEAEPEAKPEAEADPYYYLGHNYAGYYGAYTPYYYGYHGVGCRNTYGQLVPCAGK